VLNPVYLSRQSDPPKLPATSCQIQARKEKKVTACVQNFAVFVPHSTRYILPDSSEICEDPHENWGVGGRWIEPYDLGAALKTIWLLRQRWTRKDREGERN